MIVCHCEQVSDRTICHAMAAGADDLASVTDACRAGGECGGCHESIRVLLARRDELIDARDQRVA